MVFERYDGEREAVEPSTCLPETTPAPLRDHAVPASEPSTVVWRFGPFLFGHFGGRPMDLPDLSIASDTLALLAPVGHGALDHGEYGRSFVLLGPLSGVLAKNGGREHSMIVFKAPLVLRTRPSITRAEAVRAVNAPHLADHLRSVTRALLASGTPDLEELAEMTSQLLETLAASQESFDIAEPCGSPVEQRHRIERIIEENIASARLSTRRIATLAGISRSALYRLFDGAGGVAAHVRGLRLALAHADLLDSNLLDLPINEIAQRRGLHCTASFNRAYRRAFGATPGETRAMACRRDAAST